MRGFEGKEGRTKNQHEIGLPENINVTIANPGVEQLRTEISGLGMAFVAGFRAINKKLDFILDSIGTGNDPEAIAKIRAATAKLKSDTDTLEGAVQAHSSEGQG
jgi:hypothetical protein